MENRNQEKAIGINMNEEEVERTLEELLQNEISKESISKIGEIITYANDKGYFRLPNGNTIIDYQDKAIKMQMILAR